MTYVPAIVPLNGAALPPFLDLELRRIATAINASEVVGPYYGLSMAEILVGLTDANVNHAYPVGWVPRYGALADGTDDSPAIQIAFNVAKQSKGRVFFPAFKSLRTIYYAASIAFFGGIHVDADAGVLIRKNSGDAASHIFDGIGVLGSGKALTVNASVRATSVTVDNVSGLVVGQAVKIQDQTFKFGSDGQNLEWNEIDSIAGLVVGLKKPLISSYSTGASAELLPATDPVVDTLFENIHCEIPVGQDGGAFYFEDAYRCHVNFCSSSGQKGQAGVQTWRAGDIFVNYGQYSNGQDQSTQGKGYGIAFAQSSHGCVASHVVMRNVRENAISLGSRFCKFDSCDVYGAFGNAFNTHGDGNEDCDFVNCRSFFAKSKAFFSGGVTGKAPDKRIRYKGCKSFYSGYIAYWADGSSGVESEDIEYDGCEAYHYGDDTATSYAFYMLRSIRPRVVGCVVDAHGETNARALIKAEICTDVEISGNKLRGATNGWGIIHANCTGVLIEHNKISNIGSAQGVHAESTASTKVLVQHNKVDNDTAFTINSGDKHIFNEYATKRDRTEGSTSVADGGTINHGMVSTPVWVQCTATTASEFASVTAKNGTTFTVALKKHDNTAGTTAPVHWEAGL